MAKIAIELDNCMDCPFHDSQRHYTSDSWEMAFDFYCKSAAGRKIAGYIEKPSEMPPVPDWCPRLEK